MLEQQTPIPLYQVVINGWEGEVYVTDKGKGRYLCMFKYNEKADYVNSYDAFGFTACGNEVNGEKIIEYFPVKLRKNTKLTIDIMQNVWPQIAKQID